MQREETGRRGGRGLLEFIQYHNAVPVALGIIVLGGGGVFAATNPEAIYSATEEVLTVDNTYLVGKDLTGYSPRAVITAVLEDEENYNVEYEFHTIDVEGYVWRDVVKKETMQVSKVDLGQYRDLGLYVTQQLRQVIEREAARLTKTQENARSAVTQLTVATTYGGLIGKFLDESTEVLPGYTPVVAPAQTAAVAAVFGPAEGGEGGTNHEGGSTSASGLKIGLQLLGNNPARIPVGTQYADLGAVLVDPYNTNVGVYLSINGEEKANWTGIDTSTTTAHTIEYRATDPSGAVITVRRIVLVGDAANPGGEVSEAGNVRPVVQTNNNQDTTTNNEQTTDAQDEVSGTPSSETEASTSTPAVAEEEQAEEATEGEAGTTESEVGSAENVETPTETATTTAGTSSDTHSDKAEQATTTPEN